MVQGIAHVQPTPRSLHFDLTGRSDMESTKHNWQLVLHTDLAKFPESFIIV
jgi:hypothetical protein